MLLRPSRTRLTAFLFSPFLWCTVTACGSAFEQGDASAGGDGGPTADGPTPSPEGGSGPDAPVSDGASGDVGPPKDAAKDSPTQFACGKTLKCERMTEYCLVQDKGLPPYDYSCQTLTCDCKCESSMNSSVVTTCDFSTMGPCHVLCYPVDTPPPDAGLAPAGG